MLKRIFLPIFLMGIVFSVSAMQESDDRVRLYYNTEKNAIVAWWCDKTISKDVCTTVIKYLNDDHYEYLATEAGFIDSDGFFLQRDNEIKLSSEVVEFLKNKIAGYEVDMRQGKRDL